MIKTLLKIILFNIGFFLVLSCQKESNLLIEPSVNEILKSNSTIASLIKRTAIRDGSKDNIIDRANCLSVELPIRVIANGVPLTINSEADYLLIENIFDEFSLDIDTLTIIFPIKISLSDFKIITIYNSDELQELAKECNGENENDDDIECVDFVYPINISIYNSSSQLTQTIVVQSDEQFYKLVEDIEDYYIVQINFPISVILYDGSTQTIADMSELEKAIEAADGMCDEDDDFNYNDDDCSTCSIEQANNLLLTCNWVVEDLKINDTDKTEQYSDLVFTFLNTGIVNVKKNGTLSSGTWNLSFSNNTIKLYLNIPNFQDFNFNWELNEINENNEFEFKVDNNSLKLDKNCN